MDRWMALSTISAIICSNFCAFLIFLFGWRDEAKTRWRQIFFLCAVWEKETWKRKRKFMVVEKYFQFWKNFLWFNFLQPAIFRAKYFFPLLRTNSNFLNHVCFPYRARPNDAKKNPQGLPHVIYCRLWRWPDLQVRIVVTSGWVRVNKFRSFF